MKEHYDLKEEFNADLSQAHRNVRDTNYDWKTRYKAAVDRQRLLGWADDKIGTMSEGWCMWQQLIWSTNVLGPTLPDGRPFISSSKAHVHVGQGDLVIRHPLDLAFGSYTFHGNHPHYYHGLPSEASSTGSTQVTIDQAGWVDDPNLKITVPDLSSSPLQLRTAFKSVTTGFETAETGYHEAVQLDKVFVHGQGSGFWKPGYYTAAAILWDLGTGSHIASDGIRGHNVDSTLVIVRGTPARIGAVYGFHNAVAAVLLAGTAQNTIDIGLIESDSAPCSVLARPAFGREGGGAFNLGMLKLEDGINPESKGPWRGGGCIDFRGQWCGNVQMVSYSNGHVRPDSLLVLDDRLQDGSRQNCFFEIRGKSFNHQSIVHDVANKAVYSAAPSHSAWKVEYESRNSGIMTTKGFSPTRTASNATKRIGFARYVSGIGWTPALDHNTGTPAYVWDKSDVGGPAVATWVLGTPGPWGPCIAGTRARNVPYVSSIAGQVPTTPKPADKVETEPCVVTGPELPQTELAVNSATPVLCKLSKVKRIKFTDLVIPTGTNLADFAGYLVDDEVYAGFGQLYMNDPGRVPSATFIRNISAGQKVSFEIVFVNPLTVKYAVGSDMAKKCPWSAAKVELFPS